MKNYFQGMPLLDVSIFNKHGGVNYRDNSIHKNVLLHVQSQREGECSVPGSGEFGHMGPAGLN